MEIFSLQSKLSLKIRFYNPILYLKRENFGQLVQS